MLQVTPPTIAYSRTTVILQLVPWPTAAFLQIQSKPRFPQFLPQPGKDVIERYKSVDKFEHFTGLHAFKPVFIMRSETLHYVFVPSKVPTEWKMEVTSTSAWDTLLNSSSPDAVDEDSNGAEEEQYERGPASKDADDSIATALQKVISDEFNQHVEKALTAISENVQKSLEHFLQAAAASGHGGTRTKDYISVEPISPESI